MLRPLLWLALRAGLVALAAMAARGVASRIWRVLAGEEPPQKK